MKQHILLALIVLLAGALRLGVYLIAPFDQEPPFVSDGGTYFTFAEDLAAGRDHLAGDETRIPPRASLPPLYPLFLGAFLRVAGPNMPLLFGVQILFSVAVVPITYWLTRRVAGNSAAYLAALFVALSPALAQIPSSITTEALYVPILVVAALCCFLAVERGSFALSVLAGATCGAASLSRNVAMLLPGAVLLCALMVAPRRRALRSLAGVILGWLIAFAPWAAYKLIKYGTLSPYSTKQASRGMTMYALMASNGFMVRPERVPWLYDDPEEAEARYIETVWKPRRTPGYVPPVTGKYFVSHPGDYLKQAFWRLFLLVEPESTGTAFGIRTSSRECLRTRQFGLLACKGALYALDAIFLLAAAAGIVLVIPHWRRFAPLYAILGYFFAVHVFVFSTTARYRYPLIPLLAVFAAVFFARSWQYVKRRRLTSRPEPHRSTT